MNKQRIAVNTPLTSTEYTALAALAKANDRSKAAEIRHALRVQFHARPSLMKRAIGMDGFVELLGDVEDLDHDLAGVGS
jgi:hypothetical protein